MCSLAMKLSAQQKDLLLQLMEQSGQEVFKRVLADPSTYEVQIVYTQINRSVTNYPKLRTYTYRSDPTLYFYPASTVKLPVSVFALEKLNELHIAGLNKHTPLTIDSAYKRQTAVRHDETAQNTHPSIGHYIKKIMLVSDNDAFNRLYEFLGQKAINDRLQKYELNHSRIVHRLSVGDTEETARHTNPFTFITMVR